MHEWARGFGIIRLEAVGKQARACKVQYRKIPKQSKPHPRLQMVHLEGVGIEAPCASVLAEGQKQSRDQQQIKCLGSRKTK